MRDWKRVWSAGNIAIEINYESRLVTIIDSESPASCLTFDEARDVAIALSQMISLFNDDQARELATIMAHAERYPPTETQP